MILEEYKQHEHQLNQLHDEIKELKQKLDDQNREVMENLSHRPPNTTLPAQTLTLVEELKMESSSLSTKET
jgi:predicted Holliday junction resolvase-like endonuclease